MSQFLLSCLQFPSLAVIEIVLMTIWLCLICFIFAYLCTVQEFYLDILCKRHDMIAETLESEVTGDGLEKCRHGM